MQRPNPDQLILLVLRLGTFMCFAGWAWVHLYWEAPYGVLLWQDNTYSLAEKLGIDWNEFVGTGANDGFVQKWITRLGWVYVICAVLSLSARKKARIQLALLGLGSGLLTLLSYAKFIKAERQLPMLVEQGGQILIPVVLILALVLGIQHRATVNTAIAAFILTFVGHGSYALGLWPTPGTYYGMTKVILDLDYESTNALLRIFGVLDFIVCIGIFVPVLRKASIIYAIAWGALTAIARPLAGMSTELNFWGADQYLHEAVLRAPHFIIPLYLFLVWRDSETTDSETPQPKPNSELIPTVKT